MSEPEKGGVALTNAGNSSALAIAGMINAARMASPGRSGQRERETRAPDALRSEGLVLGIRGVATRLKPLIQYEYP